MLVDNGKRRKLIKDCWGIKKKDEREIKSNVSNIAFGVKMKAYLYILYNEHRERGTKNVVQQIKYREKK